jgi:hypothetical protein
MRKLIIVCLMGSLLAACAGTAMNYQKNIPVTDLRTHDGERVELRGRVSNTPWQHLIANPEGFPHSCYFDVDDYQIVVYSKQPIVCQGLLSVRGAVVKVQGSSQRPGTKADETFVEYHLAADEWDCR